jgi:RNA polymerase sigma-70 factor (ECF subfamily)
MYPITQPRTRFNDLPHFTHTTPASMATLSEAILIEQCIAGSDDAWDTLFHRYGTSIYKMAYSLCQNHEDTSDIAGQVYLHLYMSLHTFRNEAGFTSWLFRIVRNTYLDLCVRPGYRSHVSLDAGSQDDGELFRVWDIVDPAPSPETICLENESAQELATAIRHLPTYQRQVMQIYAAGNISYQEIAEATTLSLGTVKSRINRARRTLRERLA